MWFVQSICQSALERKWLDYLNQFCIEHIYLVHYWCKRNGFENIRKLITVSAKNYQKIGLNNKWLQTLYLYIIYVQTFALPEISSEKDSLSFHMLSMAALFNYFRTLEQASSSNRLGRMSARFVRKCIRVNPSNHYDPTFIVMESRESIGRRRECEAAGRRASAGLTRKEDAWNPISYERFSLDHHMISGIWISESHKCETVCSSFWHRLVENMLRNNGMVYIWRGLVL